MDLLFHIAYLKAKHIMFLITFELIYNIHIYRYKQRQPLTGEKEETKDTVAKVKDAAAKVKDAAAKES